MSQQPPVKKTAKTKKAEDSPQALQEQLVVLQQQVQNCQEAQRRSQADYANLVRRTAEERQNLVQYAEQALIQDLLQPLDHLDMAANQLQDKGLLMVTEQLWKTLSEHGLEQLQVLGQPYDLEKMEVVEIEDGVAESEAVVIKIVKQGYQLNGKVIQHAKVVLGA
ncbi:MAG: nucleotide exchange factor GrpE [Patescibacteria group bacterium]